MHNIPLQVFGYLNRVPSTSPACTLALLIHDNQSYNFQLTTTCLRDGARWRWSILWCVGDSTKPLSALPYPAILSLEATRGIKSPCKPKSLKPDRRHGSFLLDLRYVMDHRRLTREIIRQTSKSPEGLQGHMGFGDTQGVAVRG